MKAQITRIGLEILLLIYTLVLLILGDSYLKWFLWGGLGLGWLGVTALKLWRSAKEVDSEKFNLVHPAVASLYFCFVVWLSWSGVSMWWSHYVPLGLARLTQVMTGIVGLEIGRWLISGLSTAKLSYELAVFKRLSLGIVLIGWVLACAAMFFMMFPTFAKLLPGFNILVATYGHSHVAAFFILALPIQLWFALTNLHELKTAAHTAKKWWMQLELGLFLVLMAVPVLMMATSFGRVAMLVGMVQVAIWFVAVGWLKRVNRITVAPEIERVMGFFGASLGLVLLVVLSILILTSAWPKLLSEDFCKTSQYKIQLCKSFAGESRFAYWSQGWKSFTRWPWTGYGLGTFALVSANHRLINWQGTSYAHNEYLSQFVETGVVGGVLFVGLMASSIWLVSSLLKLKEAPSEENSNPTFNGYSYLFFISLALSWLGMMVNVFFDFDWSFSGLWFLSWIILGIITQKLVEKTRKAKRILLPRLFGRVHTFVAVWLVAMMLAFGMVEVAVWQGYLGWVVQRMPFFVEHTVLLATSDGLRSSEKQLLFEQNKFYPKMVNLAIDWSANSEREAVPANSPQKFWYRQLMQIDPWGAISQLHSDESVLAHFTRQELEEDLAILEELYRGHVQVVGKERVEYWTKQVILKYKKRLVLTLLREIEEREQHSRNIDYETEVLIQEVAQQIHEAQDIDTWVMANWSDLGVEISDEAVVRLVAALYEPQSHYFSLVGTLWVGRLSKLITNEFKHFEPQTSPSRITQLVNLILYIQPKQNWKVWELVSQQYLAVLIDQDMAVKSGASYELVWPKIVEKWGSSFDQESSEWEQVLLGWNEVYEVIVSKSNDEQLEFTKADAFTSHIGYLLMALETARVIELKDITFDAYALAWQRNPYSLQKNKKVWWISTLDISQKQQLSSEEIFAYLDQLNLKQDPANYGWLVKEHQELINMLVVRILNQADQSHLEKVLGYYQQLPYFSSDTTKNWLVSLDQLWPDLTQENRIKIFPQWWSILMSSTGGSSDAVTLYQEQILGGVTPIVNESDMKKRADWLTVIEQTFSSFDELENIFTYKNRVLLAQNFQKIAVDSLDTTSVSERWLVAEKATQLMQLMLPDDYFVLEQLGNLYLVWAHTEPDQSELLLHKADQAYQVCLDRYAAKTKQVHINCSDSRRDMYQDPPYMRFHEVAQILVRFK